MIAHYKERLTTETDPQTIMTLRGLLAEEQETEQAEKANLPPMADHVVGERSWLM
jgi:hypothetical protein